MLNRQRGIGLIEVLVALLLLAVAVLGFSAMQMQAIKATDETLIRSDAMVVVRNISEDIRLYPTTAQKQAYRDYINTYTATTAAPTNCTTTVCNKTQQVQYNAYQALQLASQSGINVGAVVCPDTGANAELRKTCLIASWGGTLAQMSTNAQACANTNGTYKPGAKCFIMETY